MGRKLEAYKESVEEKVQAAGERLGLSQTEIDDFLDDLEVHTDHHGQHGFRARSGQGMTGGRSPQFAVELSQAASVRVEFTDRAIREFGDAYPNNIHQMSQYINRLLRSNFANATNAEQIIRTAEHMGYVRVIEQDTRPEWEVTDLARWDD